MAKKDTKKPAMKKAPTKKPATKEAPKKDALPPKAKRDTPPPSPAKAPEVTKKEAPVAGDTLSVSDVAREMGIDPKKARAALRAAGRGADGRRYARVRRGSDEHTALMLFLEGNEDGVNSSPKGSE